MTLCVRASGEITDRFVDLFVPTVSIIDPPEPPSLETAFRRIDLERRRVAFAVHGPVEIGSPWAQAFPELHHALPWLRATVYVERGAPLEDLAPSVVAALWPCECGACPPAPPVERDQ